MTVTEGARTGSTEDAWRAIPGPRGARETARWGVALVRTPHRALLRLHREFGPVVGITAGRERVVLLFGPAANRFVFAHDEYFRWREAFEFLVPLNGETALVVSDGDAHRRRRRLVTPAFGRASIEGYVPTFTAAADRVIDGWSTGDVVDLHAELRTAVRRATLSVLFGGALAGDADALGAEMEPLLRFVDGVPAIGQLRRALRSPGWRAARAARERVDVRVRAEIRRRRETPGNDAPDVLGRLTVLDEHGDGLCEEEIRDQVVSLTAAGFETTAAGLSWACLALLTRPDVAERARREVRAVCGDRPPTAAELAAMPYLGGVVSESLRLWPPAVASARHAVRGFSFGGYDVPAGVTVQFSPLVTQRMPEVYADPERFDPERWDRAAPGYRPRPPEEFAPFGGGRHRCIGSALATTEMTAMLARLLVRADVTPVPGPVEPVGIVAMRPRHGAPARVWPPAS